MQIIRTRVELAKNDPLTRSSLRVMQYEAADGAAEITRGVFCLCCTLAMYAVILPGTSMTRAVLAWAMIMCAFLASGLPKAIRKRITWPRTGYVVPRPPIKAWWIMRVFMVVVAAGISFGLMKLTKPEKHDAIPLNALNSVATGPGAISPVQKAICAGFGGLSALTYLVMAAPSFRKHPWKWPLLALMALGPVGITLIVPGNFLDRFRPVALFVALVWLGSGAATLYSYIRHTPPASGAA